MENFIVEKREDFRYVPIGGCYCGEVVGGPIRGRTSYVTGEGCIFGFLWLVLSWKLPVINQVLPVLGW